MPLAARSPMTGSRSGRTTRRRSNARRCAAAHEVGGVTFDTLLAGYLLDPGAADYPLRGLGERYLGADVMAHEDADDAGQLFADDPWRSTAAQAAAVGLLAPVMEEAVDRAGLRSLLADVELPLSSVLARMEARGVTLDAPYLEGMATDVRERMAALTAEVYAQAGREFNLNSPPQLREILYGELGLQPGKKTPKGELSTDASVLEKLRDAHPIVDGILSWRELDKLDSTYLQALPKLVDPRDGRVHTTFNQAAAATGRLSSTNPNLQNVPIRSELGREIRRSFIPGGPDLVLLVADYSQIELRILAHLSGDEGLREAFRSGTDIHAATAATRVRPADRPGRRRAPAPREDGQLRPRLRDECLRPRAAARHRAGRGRGDHRRVFRGLPEDQGVPARAGRTGAAGRLHGDAARAPPVHPRAHEATTAASASSANGRRSTPRSKGARATSSRSR